MKYDEETGKWFLRNSERKEFKRCRWAWKRSYIDGLRPRKESVHLSFGTMVHNALEGWYVPGKERGTPPLTTFLAQMEAAEHSGDLPLSVMYDEDGEYAGMLEMGEYLLGGYVQHYGTEPHIEILKPEQEMWVDIYDEKGDYVVTAVGTMDALYYDHNERFFGLLEHKTWKSVRTGHLQIDEQASTYWALAPIWLKEEGLFGPEDDISVMLYNVMRKTKPDLRPRDADGYYLNKDGSISKRQPAPVYHRIPVWRDVHDRDELLKRMVQEAKEIKMVQEGILHAYKNPGYLCPSMCSMFDICEIHETGGDWEELAQMTMVHRDPYETYADEPHLRLE